MNNPYQYVTDPIICGYILPILNLPKRFCVFISQNRNQFGIRSKLSIQYAYELVDLDGSDDSWGGGLPNRLLSLEEW